MGILKTGSWAAEQGHKSSTRAWILRWGTWDRLQRGCRERGRPLGVQVRKLILRERGHVVIRRCLWGIRVRPSWWGIRSRRGWRCIVSPQIARVLGRGC